MLLGGTVAGRFSGPEEWERLLAQTHFKAVTAPFDCRTPREEAARYVSAAKRRGAAIAEVGVWRNCLDPDPAKAKELLTEAGYPDGFDLVITVPANYQPHCDTAEVIAEQLKEVGINATLDKVEWNTWLEKTYSGRDFQATVIGLTADPLTARSLLERFTSDADNNFMNYNNAEYDELFAQAIKCYDDEEQVKIYKDMEKNLTEHAANVYIQDMADLIAVRKGLTGLTFYPLYVLDVSTLKWQ